MQLVAANEGDRYREGHHICIRFHHMKEEGIKKDGIDAKPCRIVIIKNST